MKKATLTVEEKLTYRREIIVNVPDDMDDSGFEKLLNNAERSGDGIDGFLTVLDRNGIELAAGYDDSLDSPWSVDVECEEYQFKE